MASASILTMSGDQVVSAGGASNINIDWATETKYLDADVDFFDAGTNNERLLIPASLDGVPFEVFLWMEDTTEASGMTSGIYLGPVFSGIGQNSDYFRIMRDAVRACQGYRSGPLIGDSDGGYVEARCREFESETITMRESRCRFGIISGEPTLLGAAAASENVVIEANTERVIHPDLSIDVGGDVYDIGTGLYTAPAGASLAVPMMNTFDGVTLDGTACRCILEVNGSAIAAYRHGGSGRVPGPGCFGLIAVSPGDEIGFRLDNDLGSSRTITARTSVEFY